MRRFILAVVLVIAVTPLASAADKWTAIQTTHFSLVGNASEGDIRRVGENLEQFREAVSRLLPKAKTESSVSTVVLVFKDDASYRPFKPLYNGKPSNVAGYFQSGQDVNYITLCADVETPRVIYHEFFHQVAHDTMGRLPAWFNEGFAEYYSTFAIMGKDQKVEVGQPIAEHVQILRDRSLLPMDTLFSVSHGSPYYNETGKQGLFYAQSWATIHYILLSDGGKRREQLGLLLRLLESGASAADSVAAALQMDVPTFQKQIERYMTERVTLPAMEYTFKTKLTIDAASKPRLLSEAESQFYLGDLLLHSNRLEDAETFLKKSISLDAKLAAPQASLGMLRLKQGNGAEAVRYLKAAAEADSKSPLVHFYYAQTLLREGAGDRPSAQQLDSMRSELKKSLTLSPNFLPAVDLLAYVNLMRNADMDETAAALRSAVAVAPGRDDLLMRLAEVLSRAREFTEARGLLQKVSGSSSAEPVLKERAASLLQYIDFSEIAKKSGAPERAADRAEADTLPPFANDGAEPPTIRRQTTVAATDPGPTTEATEATALALKRVNPETGKSEIVPGSTEGQVLLGLLTGIECSDAGITFVVSTGETSLRLRTQHIEDVQFVSYTQAVKGELECGPLPSVRVRINYKPDPSGRTQGAPLVVAFVE